MGKKVRETKRNCYGGGLIRLHRSEEILKEATLENRCHAALKVQFQVHYFKESSWVIKARTADPDPLRKPTEYQGKMVA